MTALTEFQRLEAQGQWRAGPSDTSREVVVSLGDATLIIRDPRSETPLSHWSLPAVTRLNPGRSPAIYAPGTEGADETVEIDDPLMRDAIERVHRAIESRRAHPGRLRGVLTVVAIMILLGGLIVWLPGAIIRHAGRIAPPAQARDVGQMVLTDITASTGKVCSRASGQQVLDWLIPRILGDQSKVRVVPGPLNSAIRLPGNLYVMGNDLLQGAGGAEAVAGHLIAASLARSDEEIRQIVLADTGVMAAIRLMTLGSLPDSAVEGTGLKLLSAPAPRPDDQILLGAMETARISSEPYARSVDPTGESVLGLIEADPFRNAPPIRPLLTPEQWRALQQICAG